MVMRLAPGARLGPYEILSRIGAGGKGDVYRARDPRAGHDVAVKILRGDLQNFERQLRAAAVIRHPNVLAIYEVGEHNSTPYIVSELLEGETLRARLSTGPLPTREAMDCAAAVTQGLSAAHRQGVAHGDLKPENIFLTRDGGVKLLGLGLAANADPSRDWAALDAILQEMLSRPGPGRRRFLAASTGVAAAAGAFYIGTQFGRRTQPAFHRLTFRRGMVRNARFVPGGQDIVYDAEWEGKPPRIFSARAGTSESRLFDLPPARLLSVSRAGELAIKLDEQSTLARVPLAGGAPRAVLHYITWADWGPDGASFLVSRQVRSHQRIDFPIGRARYETEHQIDYPRVSRDGSHIAFFETVSDGSVLNVIDLAGGKRTLTAPWKRAAGLAWNGKEIWFSAANGTDAPSLRAMSLGGAARPVLSLPLGVHIADVADDGRALFTAWSQRAAMLCQPPGAESARDLSWFHESVSSDLSPDGSSLLFTESHGTPRAWLRKTDGSPAAPLGDGRALALSPDAQFAAVLLPSQPRQLRIVPAGGGEQRVLQAERFTYAGARWFPDGKRLLVWGNQDDRLRRHFVQDAAGGAIRAISAEGSAAEAAISPDGEFVAAYCGPGVFLFPVNSGDPQPARGNTAGAIPVAWSDDARFLYIRRGYVIELVDLKTGKSETWKDLTPADPGGIAGIENVAITPDGRAYVYSYLRSQSDLYLLDPEARLPLRFPPY